eukprot:SAG31_NODE_761_length_12276_cov_4.530673_8_plen_145_part_00
MRSQAAGRLYLPRRRQPRRAALLRRIRFGRRLRGSATMTSPKRGLAEYHEGAKLGQGAYGAAILATRLADGKDFVLKKIVMRNVKSDKEIREVKREVHVMRLLAEKCDHPNIVAFYDAFMEQDTLHIVMVRCCFGVPIWDSNNP